GQEVVVVVHRIRNRIPGNRDATVPCLGHDSSRGRWQFFLLNRLSSAPFTCVPSDLEFGAKSQRHFVKQPLLHHVPRFLHPTLKQSRKSRWTLTCFKHLEERSLTNGKRSRQGSVVSRERVHRRENPRPQVGQAGQQQQGTNPGQFRLVRPAQESGIGIRL